MREIEVEGKLTDVGYPELLRYATESEITGSLLLTSGGSERQVFFQSGRVIFARSNNQDDRLGEFLLRHGVIGVEAYEESARRIAPGKRQGAILCEMGSISADDLLRYVKEQVTEIVCGLFLWESGEYEIRETGPTEESIVLSISLDSVIRLGIAGVTSWARIWQGVGGSLECVYAATPIVNRLSYESALSDEEVHVLALVNGRLSLGKLLGLSYETNFETCRFLWSMLLIGALEPVPSEAGAGVHGKPSEDYALADVVEAYDRLFAFTHQFVAERLGDLVDHFMDKVALAVLESHPAAFSGVSLRNQARVEYEQVFANLAHLPATERHRAAVAALDDLVDALLEHTAKELGPEEEVSLADELLVISGELSGVDLLAVLEGRGLVRDAKL